MVCENLSVNSKGHLSFAGQDVVDLAAEYATPLYLMDEDRIKEKCRIYKEAMKANFREGSGPLFASKACSFKQLYRIMQEESMGIDVVSSGEIYTAKSAGFDMAMAMFHGNNKTDDDVNFAMEQGVGYFVADNKEELDSIEEKASARGITQKVILRITPGIDPHTYAAIATGKVDSKFGAAIETGQAEELTEYALYKKHIDLKGFHCHVGSQVFAEDVFERATKVMLEFIADMNNKFGYKADVLDLGGGFGVRYVDSDPYLDIAEKLESIAKVMHETCEDLGIEEPIFHMEPGRSIVADAGLTVYHVGTLKKIPGYKTYVSIDGGMTDNPRFALYGSKYTCLAANKMNEETNMECSVVGRCCESGDIIQEHVMLPESIGRGDILAVCTTGAYNYSMASNYNRIARPAVVMLKEGKSYIAVKRESLEDLVSLDV